MRNSHQEIRKINKAKYPRSEVRKGFQGEGITDYSKHCWDVKEDNFVRAN